MSKNEIKYYLKTYKLGIALLAFILFTIVSMYIMPSNPKGETREVDKPSWSLSWLKLPDFDYQKPEVIKKATGEVFEWNGIEYTWTTYMTQPGDTFSGIASTTLNDSSPEAWNKICKKNGYLNCSNLHQGRDLLIPTPVNT